MDDDSEATIRSAAESLATALVGERGTASLFLARVVTLDNHRGLFWFASQLAEHLRQNLSELDALRAGEVYIAMQQAAAELAGADWMAERKAEPLTQSQGQSARR